jgi:hypothetical protein
MTDAGRGGLQAEAGAVEETEESVGACATFSRGRKVPLRMSDAPLAVSAEELSSHERFGLLVQSIHHSNITPIQVCFQADACGLRVEGGGSPGRR